MQVTRQRRQPTGMIRRLRTRPRSLRLLAAVTAAVVVVGSGAAYATTRAFSGHHVGGHYSDGIQVSDDQVIKPIGQRLLTEFGKFMASSLSPNGRFLAVTSTDNQVVLQMFDLQTYKLVWTVGTGSFVQQQLSNTTVGQEGPTWSPDGKYLWLPEANGLTRFAVNDNGTLGAATTMLLPRVNGASALPGKG